jgi:hypothetical protein
LSLGEGRKGRGGKREGPVGGCMPAGSETFTVGQGGGDRVWGCEDFGCVRDGSCIGKIIQMDSLFLLKHDSLLEFDASINLGRKTIAAQRTLVDSGASANFMSEALYRQITASGGRYTLGTGGWMRVTAAGWESGRERRRRVSIRLEIGTYAREIEFTVFDGLTKAGYDLVLGKPWLRSHNRRHEIDHITNEMWIDEEDGRRHHLRGRPTEEESREERAKALGLNTITWRAARQLQHRHRGEVTFFLARAMPTNTGSADMGQAPSTPSDNLLVQDLEGDMRRRFPTIFEAPTGIPPKRPFDMRIDLAPGSRPPYTNPYRVTPLEDAEMCRQLQLLQDDGWITDSCSPFAAPILFVKKADGSLRLCVDYRALNAVTLKDRYPLPHMDDLLNQVHGSSLFTKLDLKSGYHQMRLRTEDREKTAFTTKYGLYEWTVVPFGLANAPSAFMRTMAKLLHRHRRYCVVYLDDILIHTKGSESEHRDAVAAVLETLHGDNWHIAPGKCVWGATSVGFIGYVVDREGIHVDPGKIKAIQEWPRPKSVRDVRSFLGLTGFYRRFVHRYAAIARPLFEATNRTPAGGTRRFEWSSDLEVAFEELKQALTSAPVLTAPEEGNSEFVLHCDASKFAIGSVLSQRQGGVDRVIAYYSRKLAAPETKYAAYDRELLALKESMLAWRFFTQGNHVTIHTDHRALEQILKQRTLSSRQFGSLVALSSFDYDIRYIRGAKNVVADRLSRRADYETQEYALWVRTVDEAFFSTTEEAQERGISQDWLSAVREGYEVDRWLGPVLSTLRGTDDSKWTPAELRRAGVRAKRFTLSDGLLVVTDSNRLAIPEVGTLRRELLVEHHDTVLGGHFGRERTAAALRKRFYWPKMARTVAAYVKGCDVCHRVKPVNERPFGKLEQLAIPETRWSRIGIDLVTKLPRTKAGHDCIITIVDHLTKRAHFLPATEAGLSADAFAKLFVDFYLRLHGVPDVIVSDQDPRFLSDFWTVLTKLLGVKLGMSSPYHPQTDGQTEKVNHIVGTYLRAFARQSPDTWSDLLPLCEFSYNSSLHTTTGKTPFELDLGYTPRTPLDLQLRSVIGNKGRNADAASSFAEKMQFNLDLARDCLQSAQDAQKLAADDHRQDAAFKIGQQVYLNTKNLPLTYSNVSDQRSRKLQDLFDGPFTIVKASKSPNAWYLDLPDTWNVKQPLNVGLFRKDWSDPTRPRSPPPVKQSIHGSEYLVEEVVGHEDRWEGNNNTGKTSRFYRLRWTGWNESHDTWEPLSNLENCSELVEGYHRKMGWNSPTWPRRSRRLGG